MKVQIKTSSDPSGQQALHVDGERSLVWQLVPVLALTAGAILWIGSQFWTLHQEAERTHSHDFRLMELSERIVYLDEVLTMSARMAAATLDVSWEDRYRRHESQLDEANKESSLTELSSFEACLAASLAQAVLSNLKITVAPGPQGSPAGEIYGKVVNAIAPGVATVRFTSISPELKAWVLRWASA